MKDVTRPHMISCYWAGLSRSPECIAPGGSERKWDMVRAGGRWRRLGRGGMVHTKAQNPQRPPRSQQESRGRLGPKFGAPQTPQKLDSVALLWSQFLLLLFSPLLPLLRQDMLSPWAACVMCPTIMPGGCRAFSLLQGPPGLGTSLPGQASAGKLCSLL